MIRRRCILSATLASVALFLGGCGRSLFADSKANATQFDAYDRIRGDSKPATVPDVFGVPQPALRARLGSND